MWEAARKGKGGTNGGGHDERVGDTSGRVSQLITQLDFGNTKRFMINNFSRRQVAEKEDKKRTVMVVDPATRDAGRSIQVGDRGLSEQT